MELMKQCAICEKHKEYDDFHRDKSRKDGWRDLCKDCQKKYREQNRERIAIQASQWAKNNRDKINTARKLRHAKNKDAINARKREHYKANKEEMKALRREYYKRNTNKILAINKKSHQKNKAVAARCIKRYEEKMRSDPRFQLNRRMKTAVRRMLRNGKEGKKWTDLVGYTVDALARRLKRTMPEGYTWQDFMEGKLHIDHIIPVKVFSFTNPCHLDFRRCWALNNLQLLPAHENLVKRARLENPFQPCLML